MNPVTKKSTSIVKDDDKYDKTIENVTHLLALDVSGGKITYAIHKANFRQFVVRLKKVRKLRRIRENTNYYLRT